MAITNNSKKELFNIITNNIQSSKESNELAAPVFKNKIITNDFLTKINNKFSFTASDNAKIISIKHYTSYMLIIVQYGAKKESAFCIFDENNKIIYGFKQIEELSGTVNIPEIKETWLNDSGQLFFLLKKDSKIYFAKLTNILSDLEDYINNNKLIPYFDLFFDISTEITLNNKGEKLKVKKGNKKFLTYNKIGFNVDFYKSDTFAFTLWNSIDKTIFFIRFKTSKLGITNINNVDFLVNEEISLSQANGLKVPGSKFSNLSQLAVMTGDQNLKVNEKNLGSIVYSTELDAGSEVIINQIEDIKFTNDKPISGSYDLGTNNWSHNFTRTNSFQSWFQSVYKTQEIVLLNNTDLQVIRRKIKEYFDSSPLSVEAKEFYLIINNTNTTGNASDFYGSFNDKKIKISKDNLVKFKDSLSDLKLTCEINVHRTMRNTKTPDPNFPSDRFRDNWNYSLEVNLQTNYYLHTNKGKQEKITLETNYNTPYTKTMNLTGWSTGPREWYDVVFREDSFKLHFKGLISQGVRNGNRWNLWMINDNDLFVASNNNLDIKLEIKRKQKTLNENNSSQIIITESELDKKRTYLIKQSENNSYDGTNPIFLSPLKCLISLKSKKTNKYKVFMFNGKESTGADLEINRFLNITSANDFIGINRFKVDLLNPLSITKILKNNIVLASNQYELKGQKLTFLIDILKNDEIIIEYKTKIKKPIPLKNQLGFDNKMVLNKILNNRELPTNNPTIIGGSIKEESLINKLEIMNIYNKDSDYDSVAELDIPNSWNIKVKHVSSFRQKNLIKILLFNEDYSKHIEAIQIYPQSKYPYTFLPYEDSIKNVQMERVNANKDNKKEETVFDNRISDIATSSGITTAATIANKTDFNLKNNKIEILGKTNKTIFSLDRVINKKLNEVKNINFNLTTKWNNTNDGETNENKNLSNTLAKLFNPTSNLDIKDITFKKVLLLDNNKNVIKEIKELKKYFEYKNNKMLFKMLFIKKNAINISFIQFVNEKNKVMIEDKIKNKYNNFIYQKEFEIK